MCRQSCVGQFCYSNENCSVRGECCSNNHCTTLNCPCRSKFDCGKGQYCCGPTDRQNYCGTNCTGIKCYFESSCSPGESCTYPDRDCVLSPHSKRCRKRPFNNPVRKCFSRNGCFSHNGCNSFGSGYFCCRDTMFSSTRSCYSNCINKFCNEDSDCGGLSECCDRKKKRCVDCPKTSNDFPVWAVVVIIVFGVLVVISLICGYVRCKKYRVRVSQQRPSQPSPTAQQEIQTMPPWSTETENVYELSNIYEQIDIGLPSAPPLQLYPSTMNLPPPPSYESLFQKR